MIFLPLTRMVRLLGTSASCTTTNELCLLWQVLLVVAKVG